MKRFAQILCVLTAVSTSSTLYLHYADGRTNGANMWGYFFLLIAAISAALLTVLLLVVTLIVALVKGRERRTVAWLTGVAVLFLLLPFMVKPQILFQAGFRAHIKSSVTPDELRQIAATVQEMLPDDGRLPGPKKESLWREEQHRPMWRKLAQTTQIQKLDPSLVIFKHGGTVELDWGGALAGHWGVEIDTGAEPRDGDIARGIRTFADPG